MDLFYYKMPFLFLLLIKSLFQRGNSSTCTNCNFKNCAKLSPDKLNIHLVPHTHDDAGWLKTVDQYYYGGNKRHAPFGVQYIIDSVIAELEANETRRFTYVESSFLWRWWHDRKDYHRRKLRKLVKDGRLQITHGGWVMSDEATPHYTGLIHQMSFGLRFIKETFGECSRPNVAWQIDAFGHSSEVAMQFAEMGYDGVFFGRIDQNDYINRKNEKTLEMMWRPDPDSGQKREIFTGVLYNLYMPPDGFCFDIFCNDEPIIDNPQMHENNVLNRVSSFIYQAKQWATAYRTNNVMITMGGDFNYMVAGTWFVNMDKLIKYGNEMYKDVNLIYSTPTCYLNAVQQSNITLPVKGKDDFFPYSSYEGKYWTGYYTSRPTLKYLVHKVNQLLIACNSLTTFLPDESINKYLFLVRRVAALVLHHDAITGTEKQHVAADYTTYLQEALTSAEHIFTKAYRKHFGNHFRHQHFCMKTNISECKLSEERSIFTVNLYNPLSRVVDSVVRLPVPDGHYVVYSHEGRVDYELVPLPWQIVQLPGRISSARHDIYFVAENLQPLSITSFNVKRERTGNTKFSLTDLFEETGITDDDSNGILAVNNHGLCQLLFNTTTGLLKSIVIDGEVVGFEQNFYYYSGSRHYDFRASGAYTFGSSNIDAKPIAYRVSLRLFTGRKVIEVHQTFDSWASQVIRIKKDDCNVEFDWLIGPIDTRGRQSKEIITRYKTDIKSDDEFWTDSNGRRFMLRKRNWRSSWRFISNDKIASNYYPVTSAARISDDRNCLTVLTDRAQGATSLKDGELEFMLHRRLVTDDGKGVLEPLNEVAYNQGLVARGTHTVQFVRGKNGCQGDAALEHRNKALMISSGPWMSLNTAEISTETLETALPKMVEPMLNKPLPTNVHIMSLERRSNETILIRIEHIFEKHEHKTWSHSTTVSFGDLFRNIKIHNAEEMTLDGNQCKRCKRNARRNVGRYSHSMRYHPMRPPFSVRLHPMQIRTFLLTISEK